MVDLTQGPAAGLMLAGCLVLLVVAGGAGAQGDREAQQAAIREAYQRAEATQDDALEALVVGGRVEAHWLEGGEAFWYRRDVGDTREFLLVGARQGTKRPAFDHARLATALAAASGARVSATLLPFRSVDLSADGRGLRFYAFGKDWQCDLNTYECQGGGATEGDGGQASRLSHQAPDGEGEGAEPEQPAPEERPEEGQSPDGRWVATVRDGNVWVRAKAGGEERQLSATGDAEHAFCGLAWAPDSQRLVAYRTDPGDHLKIYAVESRPQGSLRPKLHEVEYALPGDKADTYEMWCFDPAAGTGQKVDTDLVGWGGPPWPYWRPDGARFLFQQEYRGYQRVRVAEVDTRTGTSRTIIDERSRTFLPGMKRVCEYLGGGQEILWASERDGWNHLYLYNGETGELERQVTDGPWAVRHVERVDEAARTVLFQGEGRNPEENPYHVHWYRVGLDGTGFTVLTEGDGTHSLEFSPDGRYYLDRYSRVDLPPVTELRRAADGSLVCQVEAADASALLATGWRPPEVFHAKGRDGQTDIWGIMHLPSHLEPGRKYPVIEDIYAGPQGSAVPTTFAVRRGQQALAELGFVVVQLDGMGMSERSKAFHDVAWHNLGDSGFPDRILWMKAAVEERPFMDVSRVGIYGVSAGGYNAAHALIAHPEFYKVAIASAGNHDHRTDKVWWNELWMGYPVGPWYAEQSNVEQAAKLQGKLLLIHGELDDNVNPWAATGQLVDALIRADKDFDLLIVPGAGHGPGGPYVTRRMWDYFVRNLQGVEPPDGYHLSASSGSECTITIRNTLPDPVEIFWIQGEGQLRKYHDLAPGQEVRQHTYAGHEWEAHRGGRPVATYRASAGRPVWVVGGE
jgi:dipeptidyl-peptidase 4